MVGINRRSHDAVASLQGLQMALSPPPISWGASALDNDAWGPGSSQPAVTAGSEETNGDITSFLDWKGCFYNSSLQADSDVTDCTI